MPPESEHRTTKILSSEDSLFWAENHHKRLIYSIPMLAQMQQVILGLSLLAIAFVACTDKSPSGEQANSSSAISNLTALVALPADSLNQLDIARMNLLCAEGLPGADRLDITDSLTVIDQMVARVRSETERHAYRFQQRLVEFEDSSGSNPEDAIKPLG